MVLVKKIVQMRVSLARIYSTLKSNLNVAKLKGKLKAQGFPSNQAEAITSTCVKSMEDRLNILANSHARKEDLEKMKTPKEVELSTCKFELQMLQKQHSAPMERLFIKHHNMIDGIEKFKFQLNRLYQVKSTFLYFLADSRFHLMVYAFLLLSIISVIYAFIFKYGKLSFEESPGDDDLSELTSPF